MRQGLLHAGAWMLTTSAAIALSWFGVHSVLADTAYEPPRALPIPDDRGSGEPASSTAPPESSSTHRPKPAATPGTAGPSAGEGAGRAVSTRPKASDSSPGTAGDSSSAPAVTGDVHGYTVDGGRVALELGDSSATLVSATPHPGWTMRVWKQEQWIRVSFTSAGHTSSVFCTWNGHPPLVDTYEE